MTDATQHWEEIYRTKTPGAVSWYAPHLERSLALIEKAVPDRSATIIDVGAGESTLIDDLISRGYRNLTALDISQTALDFTKARLGKAGVEIRWICGDVSKVDLTPGSYDVWHDRAVFHFLTSPELQRAYIRRVEEAVKSGGHVILSTFGPEGPTRCSGLEVVRYSADSLQQELGSAFRLIESAPETHRTPSGATQQFLYCLFRRT